MLVGSSYVMDWPRINWLPVSFLISRIMDWTGLECRRIEELVGVQCTWIGVGPGREAMVVQDSKWIQ